LNEAALRLDCFRGTTGRMNMNKTRISLIEVILSIAFLLLVAPGFCLSEENDTSNMEQPLNYARQLSEAFENAARVITPS